MELKQLSQYLISKGFIEESRNTFTKKYRVRDSIDESKNFVKAIYKITKGRVFFRMKGNSATETLKKGSLSHMSINEAGEIQGLNSTIK